MLATASQVDTAEAEPSCQRSVHFVARRQMAAEGQDDSTAPDVEVHTEHRAVTELLRTEQSIYEDQHVDVSAVRLQQWQQRCKRQTTQTARLFFSF